MALRAKLRHPFKVKIVRVPGRWMPGGKPHFFWCDETGDYEYIPTGKYKVWTLLWYRGRIRKRPCGGALKYKERRRQRYLARKAEKRNGST